VEPTRYHANTTVLEDQSHGPRLCLSGLRLSNPPQGGVVDITNWDWTTVEHDALHSTKWGSYYVVGTYDGTTFTLTEKPAPPRELDTPSRFDVDFSTPCPPPPGGWHITNPAKLTLENYQAFVAAAEAPPDFVALWFGHPATGDFQRDVINVQYTGDLDLHREALSAVWGGPICVSQGRRAARELNAIRDQLLADRAELGLRLLSGGIDGRHGVVRIHVVLAAPELQHTLDARFGAGTVRLTGALQPVR
jgi:hypothetical protein